MVIDTHVHVWRGALTNGWLRGHPDLDRAFLPTHIDGGADCVFVEAAARDGVEEAQWADALDWPGLRGIVAGVTINQRRDIASQLEQLAPIARVVGVRIPLQEQPLAFFTQGILRDGLRLIAARGLTFDACVGPRQLRALAEVLREVPELDVVLDHLGKPPLRSGDLSEWSSDLASLAALPNVRVKLSGLPAESDPNRPLAPQVHLALNRAIELFGPQRSMLGSDWPVSALRDGTGRDGWFELVLASIGVTGTDRDAVAAGTAAAFYRLVRRTDECALRPRAASSRSWRAR